MNSPLAMLRCHLALTTDALALISGDGEEGRCGFAPAFFVGPFNCLDGASAVHQG